MPWGVFLGFHPLFFTPKLGDLKDDHRKNMRYKTWHKHPPNQGMILKITLLNVNNLDKLFHTINIFNKKNLKMMS